jgi:CRISPR-associated protein Csb2
MNSLTISWEYLTGYAVATDSTNRDRAEWPPHPARIFMALAAAWFETEPPDAEGVGRDEWNEEGIALRWVEMLGDPELHLPKVERSAERSNVTFYVPVNDKAGPSAAMLQTCPPITRSKQPRSYPKIWVGNQTCVLHWPVAEGIAENREALDRLCQKVTRIGHSSSLVSMRVADEAELPTGDRSDFVYDDFHSDIRVRSVSRGTLDMLRERFGEESRRRYVVLSQEIEEHKTRKLKGKEGKENKAKIQELEAKRAESIPRPPVRPSTGLWSGYRQVDLTGESCESVPSLFDHDILILSQINGPTLPVVTTLSVTKVLRKTIMSQGAQPVPDWVSGHLPDGQPLRDGNGHLALVPLPFVGNEHADGHLLGVALVFPRSVSLKERGRVLGKLLVEVDGKPKPVLLTLGSLGNWTIQRCDWQERRKALLPESWTAFATGATTWASVTPVVLDRFPKANRLDPVQRPLWEAEVRKTIAEACTRIGLPEPESINVGTTSWHLGSPRAIGKRRPLREQSGTIPSGASLGDSFPAFPPKGTGAHRPQVHVWIRFSRPVVGPVLLGAGRYLGYGLCKPLQGSQA